MKEPFSRSPFLSTSGFTAVEILVATVIMTIIAGMLLAIFNKVSDTSQYGQRSVERLDRARSTLERIRTDLSTAMISTSTPSIHFFGLSNQIYFVTISPTKDISSDTGDEMEEVGYWLGPAGRLYRAYSTSAHTAGNRYNPRLTNLSAGADHWSYPDLTNSFFDRMSENVLVAEDVVDIQFTYADATGVGTDSWFTTNLTADPFFQTNTLPSMVDIRLTVVPKGKWREPGGLGYNDFTNTYARTQVQTVHIKRGGSF